MTLALVCLSGFACVIGLTLASHVTERAGFVALVASLAFLAHTRRPLSRVDEASPLVQPPLPTDPVEAHAQSYYWRWFFE